MRSTPRSGCATSGCRIRAGHAGVLARLMRFVPLIVQLVYIGRTLAAPSQAAGITALICCGVARRARGVAGGTLCSTGV